MTHDGTCGVHFSRPSMAKCLLRMGYFWPTMENDCCEYVKRCIKCQQRANLFVRPSQALHPTQSLWSFSRWVLDLIGQITPTSSGGHKFTVTTIKYFTKWVEIVPLISTNGPKIVEFIKITSYSGLVF